MDTKELSGFDYFIYSERIETLKEELEDKSVYDLLLEAREGNTDAILFLVYKSFKHIKAGFRLNKNFGGDEDSFLNIFMKRILVLTRTEEGPFFSVDVIDGSDEEELEQLGIEFYSFSKTLSQDEDSDDELFPDKQNVHWLAETKGLFNYLNNIKPEYADILNYMVHYTPPDEIVTEMGISGEHTLLSKINSIKTLTDRYFSKEDRRDDEFKLAK